MDFEFFFGKMYEQSNIGIAVFENDELVFPKRIDDFYVIRDDPDFRHMLMKKAEESEIPVVWEEEHKTAVACIQNGERYYFIGPVALEHLNRIELHHFYFDHGMKKGMEKSLPVKSYKVFISYVQVVALFICQRAFEDDEIMEQNGRSGDQRDAEPLASDKKINLSMEESYHHTYLEEKRLLDCVREGRVEDALRMNSAMDNETGKMSKDEYSQWKKLVTVAIALTTRAAIEGGVSPAEAYSLSDRYIQKTDDCKTVPQLISCRNQAVRELTERVHRRQMAKQTSGYVERCCDYIEKHYKEKIYLDDMAEKLGISPSYLSRLFVKEKEVKLQDYIVQVRVDHAANLLMYSDESLARIGDYVNFPSQSYFGKVFRKYKGMTPKEFRERYKPKEFEE